MLMKRLIFALLLLPQLATAQYKADCFSLDLSAESKDILINGFFTKDTIMEIPVKTPIAGLSISGVATLNNYSDSYIRVILKDCYNYEHLVYENYPLLSDELTTRFSNTAIETVALDAIMPQVVKVELCHATIDITSIHYLDTSEKNKNVNLSAIQKAQCEYVAHQLNRNLEQRNMTWRAGVTSMSKKSFEEKKNMFNGKVPQMYGFEYYEGGIFVLPEKNSPKIVNVPERSISSNQYVSEWDWRNRHGRNWITPVKNQGGCGSCWAFSSIGTFEAYINLYYNQHLNFDLSEQEIVSCSNAGNCQNGGSLSLSLYHINTSGAIPEDCFSYTATNNSCDNKCANPSDVLSFEQYSYAYTIDEDSIKRLLFKSPICFGIDPWWHFVVLVGYKQIQSGDYYFTSNNSHYMIPITSDNPLVGHPAWLIKNSWGEDWGQNGFGYVAMSLSDAYAIYKLSGEVSSQILSNNDIICEDADGDGYYFWGIGPKPSNCPSWVPDTPDGDDSNINLGVMDDYGNLQTLQPNGVTINTSVIYSTNQTITNRIGIVKNGTLVITGTTTMSGNSKIRVCENGTLIVDGGTLQNANLELIPGCHVIICNNGTINMSSGLNFDATKGVIVDVYNGTIN